MPELTYEIPDVDVMITRPITMSVIRSIINVTGMPADTFIEFAGEEKGIPAWRNTLDQQPFDATNTARFGFFGKVKVGYTEEPTPETILTSAYKYPDNEVIFSDPKLGIVVAPYREQVKARLNFTYRTRDKNEAMNWRSGMRKKMKFHFIDETFAAKYNFVFPYLLVDFLDTFYKLRENVEGYGDTFQAWFEESRKKDYSVITTLNGKKDQLVFREEQLDILGNFEFDAPPIEEKVDDGNAYEIEFSYRFSFDRPIGYYLKYPLVIHNQVVPRTHRTAVGWYDPGGIKGSGSKSTVRYREMFKDQLWYKNLNRGNIVPSFDDWMPPVVVPDTTNLAQFLIKIDPNNKTRVLDLLNLTKMSFDPLLVEYMKETHPWLTKRTGSFVNISVYRNDRMVDPRDLVVDENLVIWTNTEMDLRSVYHVRVGLFTQLFVLQPFAAKFLRENPAYFKMALEGLDPDYSKKHTLPEPIGGKLISKIDYADAARNLIVTARRYYSLDYQYLLMPTQLNTLFQIKK